MPDSMKYAQQRKVVMKMTIEIVVSLCKAYFEGDRPADRVNDLLIGAAILVGEVEGHPLNASKVAELVGMARPTVIRRLAALEARGVIERKHKVFTMRHDAVSTEAVLAAGLAARRAIHKAHTELSKLDSKRVAAQKFAEL